MAVFTALIAPATEFQASATPFGMSFSQSTPALGAIDDAGISPMQTQALNKPLIKI
ncbi:hypothetical protein [Rhizobium leguminosarum]|uniref:hypothetical protein n=1 Tax=Rhizobium leguminosarum TaxID=384 RepID=UPI003ECD713C